MQQKPQHVFILSQGQLFDTQGPGVVIADLATKTGFSQLWVKSMLAFDYVRDYMPFGQGSAINRYKLGTIDTDAFCDEIRWLLGQSTTSLSNTHVLHSWNKMCVLTEKDTRNLDGISALLTDNEDLIIVTPAGTNPAHVAANIQNVANYNNGHYQAWNSLERVLLVNSHDHGTLNLNALLKTVPVPEGAPIASATSLHRAIDPSNLQGCNEGTIYTSLATNSSTILHELIGTTLEANRESVAR